MGKNQAIKTSSLSNPTKRYVVSYAPAAEFSSVDSANDGMYEKAFWLYRHALKFARRKAVTDFFGCTVIKGQELGRDAEGDYRWQNTGHRWEINPGEEPFHQYLIDG